MSSFSHQMVATGDEGYANRTSPQRFKSWNAEIEPV